MFTFSFLYFCFFLSSRIVTSRRTRFWTPLNLSTNKKHMLVGDQTLTQHCYTLLGKCLSIRLCFTLVTTTFPLHFFPGIVTMSLLFILAAQWQMCLPCAVIWLSFFRETIQLVGRLNSVVKLRLTGNQSIRQWYYFCRSHNTVPSAFTSAW